MGYNKKSALIGSLLKALQVEFFGVLVMIFFWAVAVAMGLFANILFGFTGLMCVVCIMLDFALKQGETAGSKAKLHGDDVKDTFGLTLGLAAMAPFALTAIVLAVSRLTLAFDFMPAFKVLNAPLYPLFDLFAHSAEVKDMHPAVFILVALYLALYPISCEAGFKMGYNKVDIKDKIMYKK